MRSSQPRRAAATLSRPETRRRSTTGVVRHDYDRARDLPRLLPLWPEVLADQSIAGRTALVARLRNLLRRERVRGVNGEWSYDLARHRQLVVAFRAETAALRRVQWRDR